MLTFRLWNCGDSTTSGARNGPKWAGGRILLQGYTPKQLEYKTGGPSAVENLYTEEILREAFAGWEIEELVEYEEDVAEGSAHRGRSALIGLVARKPA